MRLSGRCRRGRDAEDEFVQELNESIAQILHKHTLPAQEAPNAGAAAAYTALLLTCRVAAGAAAAPSPHKWAHQTAVTKLL